MTDLHMVEQTENSTHVVLTCHDCPWEARIGVHRLVLDEASRRDALTLAQLLRWVHADPTLMPPRSDTGERTTWARVRDYLMKGTP